MKRIKSIIEYLLAACACVILVVAPLTFHVEADNEACAGVSRQIDHETRRIEETTVETSIDTPETETPEICALNAFEEVAETEATSASYQQVTGKLNDNTEEFVEVIPEADPIIETDIDALIVQVAGEYGLPWQLVRAVCWVESRFDSHAKSDHPDYGLMQVWSEVWRSYGYDPNSSIVYDPLTNLRVGCEVLKDKIDRSDGELNYALTRYRFGDGDASARWANGDRTSWYAEEVLERYYAYLRGEY